MLNTVKFILHSDFNFFKNEIVNMRYFSYFVFKNTWLHYVALASLKLIIQYRLTLNSLVLGIKARTTMPCLYVL